MAAAPNYYEVFGVAPTASAEEIRTAYLALMKKFHPDLAAGEHSGHTSDFAAVVNQHYDVLKDPGRRARYDIYLTLHSSDRDRPANRRRALLAGASQRTRKRGWDASSIGAAVLAAAVALTSIAAVTLPSRFTQEPARASHPAVAHAAPPAGDQMLIGDVRRQVRLAMSVTPAQALEASDNCFRSARGSSSAQRTESCVIFDNAYLYWSQIADDDRPQSIYFNEALARLRQKNAMAAVGLYDEANSDELRSIALDALLAEIRLRLKDEPKVTPSPRVSVPTVPLRDSNGTFQLTKN